MSYLINKKPDLCCHPDCMNCPYEDCLYDGSTDREEAISASVEQFAMLQRATLNGTEALFKYYQSDKRKIVQKRYNHSEKGIAARRKYNETEKGKLAYRRYNQSDKGKASRQRYNESEKGKINQKKARQKRIASGKNAEYCRRYRMKKKLQEQAG